jgi:hypothetical protein
MKTEKLQEALDQLVICFEYLRARGEITNPQESKVFNAECQAELNELLKLRSTVQEFIEEQDIDDEDEIWYVLEHKRSYVPKFIKSLCTIVGYKV